MGVHGLTTFVSSNPQLLKNYKLRDSYLVVDGNAMCHKLYCTFYCDPFLGGDYDRFCNKISSFINTFTKCGVKLYVLFDGASDLDDRKFSTIMERSRTRLNIIRKARKGAFSNTHLLPILGIDALRDVLIEKNIEYMQCDFEADDYIAALANKLECPVLSQDSDFFIYPLTHGYIDLQQLGQNPNVREDEHGKYYIQTKIYTVKNLLNCFEKLDAQAPSLLAVLLGNDFVNKFDVDTFLCTVHHQKRQQTQLTKARSRVGSEIIGLLSWMQEKTFEECISKIVAFTESRRRDKDSLEQLIRKNIEVYTIKNEILEEYPTLDVSLPKWFFQRSRTAELPVGFILNIMLHKRVFFQSQMEDWKEPDSYFCSQWIRQCIYGILLQTTDVSVTEFGQNKGSQQRTHVQPVANIANKPLSSLESLADMCEESRRTLFLQILGIDPEPDDENELPNEMQLLFYIIVYWIKSSLTKVNSRIVATLLYSFLTIFGAACIQRWNGHKKNKWSIAKNTVIGECLKKMFNCKEERKLCLRRLIKYSTEARFNYARSPDFYCIHSYAQLQTCLLFASFLNRILLSALPTCRFGLFLSGTVLYNVFEELKNKADVHHLVEAVKEKEPNFYQSYYILWRWLMDRRDCQRHLTENQAESRRRKKKKNRKNKSVDENEDSDAREESNEICEVFSDINNKFDGLVIE